MITCTNNEITYIKSINFINNIVIDLYKLNDDASDIDLFGFNIPKGQIFLRNYINENYRKTFNPWCFIKNSQNLFLTIEAILYWQIYKYQEKIIAFNNDKILGLKAINNNFNLIKNRTLQNNFFISENILKTINNNWLDMFNVSHCGIPFLIKQHYKNFHVNLIYEIDEITGNFSFQKSIDFLKPAITEDDCHSDLRQH